MYKMYKMQIDKSEVSMANNSRTCSMLSIFVGYVLGSVETKSFLFKEVLRWECCPTFQMIQSVQAALTASYDSATQRHSAVRRILEQFSIAIGSQWPQAPFVGRPTLQERPCLTCWTGTLRRLKPPDFEDPPPPPTRMY